MIFQIAFGIVLGFLFLAILPAVLVYGAIALAAACVIGVLVAAVVYWQCTLAIVVFALVTCVFPAWVANKFKRKRPMAGTKARYPDYPQLHAVFDSIDRRQLTAEELADFHAKMDSILK